MAGRRGRTGERWGLGPGMWGRAVAAPHITGPRGRGAGMVRMQSHERDGAARGSDTQSAVHAVRHALCNGLPAVGARKFPPFPPRFPHDTPWTSRCPGPTQTFPHTPPAGPPSLAPCPSCPASTPPADPHDTAGPGDRQRAPLHSSARRPPQQPVVGLTGFHDKCVDVAFIFTRTPLWCISASCELHSASSMPAGGASGRRTTSQTGVCVLCVRARRRRHTGPAQPWRAQAAFPAHLSLRG